MKSLFSNPPLSEKTKADKVFQPSLCNPAPSAFHGTATMDETNDFKLGNNSLGIVQMPFEHFRKTRKFDAIDSPSNHSWKELELRLCEARAFLGVVEKQLFQLALSVPGISKELAVLRDEVEQIGYVVADAQKEVEFAAKGNRSVTAELAKAYKRFPELLSEDGNESGTYDDEKPGNSVFHNVNPVESGPVKSCNEVPHDGECTCQS